MEGSDDMAATGDELVTLQQLKQSVMEKYVPYNVQFDGIVNSWDTKPLITTGFILDTDIDNYTKIDIDGSFAFLNSIKIDASTVRAKNAVNRFVNPSFTFSKSGNSVSNTVNVAFSIYYDNFYEQVYPTEAPISVNFSAMCFLHFKN